VDGYPYTIRFAAMLVCVSSLPSATIATNVHGPGETLMTDGLAATNEALPHGPVSQLSIRVKVKGESVFSSPLPPPVRGTPSPDAAENVSVSGRRGSFHITDVGCDHVSCSHSGILCTTGGMACES
jgi:hypothetical protein